MPPESDPPAAVPPGKPTGVGPGESGRHPTGRLRLAGVLLTCALGIVTALGVARLLGEDFREAVLVELETAPVDVRPTWSDAPAEAARFFADRDTVVVTITRDMSVAEFLSLYHLANSGAARNALRDQLGAADPSDLLRQGDRVTLPLTLRRVEPAGPGGS